MLFEIRDGKLAPIDFAATFDTVLSANGCAGEIAEGEEDANGDGAYVLVTGARNPIRRVPFSQIVTVRTDTRDSQAEVYLFWAINHDHGMNHVVACERRYPEKWHEVRTDGWTRLPYRQEIVQCFRSVDDARRCVDERGLIVVEDQGLGERWRGFEIRGHVSPWERTEIPEVTGWVADLLRIPEGSVMTPKNAGHVPRLRDHLTEYGRNALSPQLANAGIVRVVVSLTGVTLVVRVSRGEKGMLVARCEFFHEEAKTHLSLKLA